MSFNASRYADRHAIEDAVTEMNELARRGFNGGRRELAVTCGKIGVGIVQTALGDPTGVVAGLLEAAGYADRPSPQIPFGPFAMFHDVMEGMRWRELGFGGRVDAP